MGPSEVRVIVESCLQASIFFRTASSRPERCLCPSLSIDCIPYGCIENPILTNFPSEKLVQDLISSFSSNLQCEERKTLEMSPSSSSDQCGSAVWERTTAYAKPECPRSLAPHRGRLKYNDVVCFLKRF